MPLYSKPFSRYKKIRILFYFMAYTVSRSSGNTVRLNIVPHILSGASIAECGRERKIKNRTRKIKKRFIAQSAMKLFKAAVEM